MKKSYLNMEFDDGRSQVLRLNLAGNPIEWLTSQEATTLYARELVTWRLVTLSELSGVEHHA